MPRAVRLTRALTCRQDTGVSVDFPYDWQEERGINFGCYLHPSNVENGCLHGEPSRNAAGWSHTEARFLPQSCRART